MNLQMEVHCCINYSVFFINSPYFQRSDTRRDRNFSGTAHTCVYVLLNMSLQCDTGVYSELTRVKDEAGLSPSSAASYLAARTPE